MTDIILYPGETSPSDIRLGDPIIARAVVGVPIDFGPAPPRIIRVYYQARFETPYQPPPMPNGWHRELSTAPVVAVQAQAGYSFVPFNTAQLSVNYSNFGWYQPLSVPAPTAKAQVGYSFVPFNTAQISAAYTNFGWYQALSSLQIVNSAQAGFAFAPYRITVTTPSPGTGCDILLADGISKLLLVNGIDHLLLFDCVPVVTPPTTDDVGGDYSLIPLYRRKKLEDELYEIELKLRDISLDIPLPGHDFPVIYDRPLLEPFSDKQQTIKVLVSRRDRVQAEYQALLKRQQDDDDDDDDSAVLLLWP